MGTEGHEVGVRVRVGLGEWARIGVGVRLPLREPESVSAESVLLLIAAVHPVRVRHHRLPASQSMLVNMK